MGASEEGRLEPPAIDLNPAGRVAANQIDVRRRCSCSFITRYDTRMSPLLVMPALPRTADVAHEALPALPALCELLRLADASGPDPGWRAGLLRDLGAGPQVFPEAVIAASALQIDPASAVCLVAPVHAVAGMHRVHLHAAGILQLAAEERSALCRGLRRTVRAGSAGCTMREPVGAGGTLRDGGR